MRLRAVGHEAWLNIVSGTARAPILALALMTVAGMLTFADLRSVHEIDAQARQFQSSGASVLVLSAPGQVDPALCTRLGTQPGVRAVGAVRAAPATAYAAAPQTSLPVYHVTPGFPAVLAPQLASVTAGGVVLSQEAADAVDARVGGRLDTLSGAATVVGIYPYPADGRMRGFGYAMLVPTLASGAFDSCWVDQWPQSEAMSQLIQGVLIPGAQENPDQAEVVLSQLNPTHGNRLDSRLQFEQRLTRWAPLAGFAAGFALSVVAVRMRRLELTSALHTGFKHRDLLAVTEVETLSWAAPTLFIGAGVTSVFAVVGTRQDCWPTVLLGMGTPAASFAAALAGTALSVALLREEHLFAYFKQRA